MQGAPRCQIVRVANEKKIMRYANLFLAIACVAAVAFSPMTFANKWQPRSEVSPMDDSRNVYLTLEADNEVSGWPARTFRPYMVLRCKEHKTSAFIQTGFRPTVEYGNVDGATVTLRFDKEKAYDINMSQSTDGEALFFPEPISYIKKMLAHKKMLFRFTPFSSSPVITAFDLTGLGKAITPLQKSCGWGLRHSAVNKENSRNTELKGKLSREAQNKQFADGNSFARSETLGKYAEITERVMNNYTNYENSAVLIRSPTIVDNGAVVPVAIKISDEQKGSIILAVDSNTDPVVAVAIYKQKYRRYFFSTRLRMRRSGNLYAIFVPDAGQIIAMRTHVNIVVGAAIPNTNGASINITKLKQRHENNVTEVLVLAESPMSIEHYVRWVKFKAGDKDVVTILATPNITQNPLMAIEYDGDEKLTEAKFIGSDGKESTASAEQ